MPTNVAETIYERVKILSIEDQKNILRRIVEYERNSRIGIRYRKEVKRQLDEMNKEIDRITEEIGRIQEKESYKSRTIWERLRAHSEKIPDKVWEEMPVDGSEQHDHHIYGTPKK